MRERQGKESLLRLWRARRIQRGLGASQQQRSRLRANWLKHLTAETVSLHQDVNLDTLDPRDYPFAGFVTREIRYSQDPLSAGIV